MSYSLHSKTGMLLRHMIEIMITLVVFGVITSAQVRPESKEVTFSGQNLILSGTLLIPNGQKQKVPGVVIVGEAGTTTRDAIEVEAVKYSVYRDLAESLAAQGVASSASIAGVVEQVDVGRLRPTMTTSTICVEQSAFLLRSQQSIRDALC